MIDVTPLQQQLLAPANRQPGTEDAELDAVLGLAEHNRLISAAEGAQRLWEAGVYDVRTLGCYLSGVFIERGLSALPLIFDCVLKALTLNWEFCRVRSWPDGIARTGALW